MKCRDLLNKEDEETNQTRDATGVGNALNMPVTDKLLGKGAHAHLDDLVAAAAGFRLVGDPRNPP